MCYFHDRETERKRTHISLTLQKIWQDKKQSYLLLLIMHLLPDLANLVLDFLCIPIKEFLLQPLELSSMQVSNMYCKQIDWTVVQFANSSKTEISISSGNAGTTVCLDCFLSKFIDNFPLHEMYDGRYCPPYIDNVYLELRKLYLRLLQALLIS